MVALARSRTRRPPLRAALITAALFVAAQGLSPGPARAQDGDFAYSIELAQDIDRGSARVLERVLGDAEKQGATVVIIRLDTPGGRIESMRAMVRDIVAASLPVIVYVYPSGGRADSAGLFLALAADVAAMAPSTNIGSATPVRIGPPATSGSEEALLRDLRRKAINDITAFARSLAEDHGRNADLAEGMVRDAANVSATRAHREGLVDAVAPTEEALLRELEGFSIKGRKARRLSTADLPIRRASLDLADVTLGGDGDESSLLRSFAYVFGPCVLLTLAAVAVGRARRPVGRWRRMRRRRKLMRR